MKWFYRLFLVLAIFIFAFSAANFFDSLSGSVTVGEQQTEDQPDRSSGGTGYVLRRSGDRLAVFVNGSQEPLRVLDVYFNDLPERDRELLESGILAQTEEQLYSLLEDYTG